VVALLCAANTVATMKNEPRLPIRITLIKQFYALLNLTSCFDTAQFACTTAAFLCTWRPSEFAVPDENGFGRTHMSPRSASSTAAASTRPRCSTSRSWPSCR
jgi:hypothetical protein